MLGLYFPFFRLTSLLPRNRLVRDARSRSPGRYFRFSRSAGTGISHLAGLFVSSQFALFVDLAVSHLCHTIAGKVFVTLIRPASFPLTEWPPPPSCFIRHRSNTQCVVFHSCELHSVPYLGARSGNYSFPTTSWLSRSLLTSPHPCPFLIVFLNKPHLYDFSCSNTNPCTMTMIMFFSERCPGTFTLRFFKSPGRPPDHALQPLSPCPL